MPGRSRPKSRVRSAPPALGTGIEPPAEGAQPLRRCRIDRESVGSAAAFAEHLRIVWLTPEMDGLFLGPAAERRRFLDRLVLAIDAEHGSRVAALERALRSRNRLLEEASPDPRWLDAIEHEVAELAVAVAAARAETRAPAAPPKSRRARRSDRVFPSAEIALDGEIEAALGDAPAIEVEDRYRENLREARPRDRAAGRTLEGPHLSDLAGAACGQGHRSRPRLDRRAQGAPGGPRALARTARHLDARICAGCAARRCGRISRPGRRAALFEALGFLGAQVFMTGVDAEASSLGGSAERFLVTPGSIDPAA